MNRVTAEHVRDLFTSTVAYPWLVRWLDTDEIEVVSSPLFRDRNWSHRDRDHEILANPTWLRQQGGWDAEHPTQEAFEALARQINADSEALTANLL